MTDHWSRSYVGLPQRDHGRDRDGVDCWGLVKLVYAERLSIDLPSYDECYTSVDEHAEIAAAISSGRAEAAWVRVDDAREFDVAVFRAGRYESHVGLVAVPGQILHVMGKCASVIEPAASPRLSSRLVGYWRHTGPASGRTAFEASSMAMSSTPILIATGLDALRRVDVTIPVGATIAAIVGLVLPGVDRSTIRVHLSTSRGSTMVDPSHWERVRPRPGISVVVRQVAAGQMLKSILMIVVTIAAVAFGQWYAPALAGTFGIGASGWSAILTTAATFAGGLLVNALIPNRSSKKERENYTISGMRNQATPDGPVPVPLGKARVAPCFAAPPYSEMVGNVQYVRVLFCWGYGPLAISDLRLGETSISDFDEIEIETRQGWPGDLPITLCPQQVIEESLGVELTRAWQRDDVGEFLAGGTTIEKSVVRYTASDSAEAAVILAFPAGCVWIDKEGKKRNRAVSVRIRQRPSGSTGAWIDVGTVEVVARQTVAFWRQHRWVLPSRGAWEIELTRMTDEAKSDQVSDRIVWQYLQSIRPEYPLAFDIPLALTAMRIKATAQLNGALDNLTGIVSRIAKDWDPTTNTWVLRETRSPAAALRWALQGPAAAYPVGDDEIDLDLLADWSEWCASKGIEYDRVHDQEASFEEVLSDIAAVGRATPRHDGMRWGVVVDRPQTLVVDEISPRNSKDFRWSRAYPERPHGFRIKFQDRTNDYKVGERVVPWPGHIGEVVVTQAMEFPGVTDPSQIWIAARRRQYEVEYRPDTYQVTQMGSARVATRGDLVALSHDVLDRVVQAGRVVRVSDRAIVVDEDIDVGPNWAARFRVFDGARDVIGRSIVVSVVSSIGRSRTILLAADELPPVGTIVAFGPASRESILCRVRSQERGEDGAVIHHLVAAAPEIDRLADEEDPPPWDGRVGAPGPKDITPPAKPVITSVVSGMDATGFPGGIEITLEPGRGSTIGLLAYEIDHRHATGEWATVSIPAASGGGALPGHAKGDIVDIRARAISLAGVPSSATDIVTITVGSGDLVVPPPTSLAVSSLASTIRRFQVVLPKSTDEVQIVGYRLRARPGVGWAWADMTPIVDGYLTSSPCDLTDPRPAAYWSVGAVAVASTGLESDAVTVDVPLGSSAGLLASRIERAAEWPGTIAGGSVVAGDLVAASTAASTVTYTGPVIDLGSDRSVNVEAIAYGAVGEVAVSMRTGASADGGALGSPGPLGATTSRYFQIMISVSSAAQARLGDFVTSIAT